MSLWWLTDANNAKRISFDHDSLITSLTFAPDSTDTNYLLASGHADGGVYFWDDMGDTPQKRAFYGHQERVGAIAFTSEETLDTDQLHLISASANAFIEWKLSDLHPLATPLVSQEQSGIAEAIFGPVLLEVPVSPILVLRSGTGQVTFWDINQLNQIGELPANVASLALSPNGQTLITGSDNGIITVWSMTTIGTPEKVTELPTGQIDTVPILSFNSDGKTFISVTPGSEAHEKANFEITIWSVDDYEPLDYQVASIQHHATYFETSARAAVSSNGQYVILAGCIDTRITKWGDEICTKHKFSLWDIDAKHFGDTTDFPNLFREVSVDGKMYAKGARGFQLWDISTEQPLSDPIETDEQISHLSFSPDGRFLMTVGDGDVTLWNIEPAAWLARVCQMVNRDLSEDEWEQFVGSQIPYQPICSNLPVDEDETSTD